MKSIKLIAIIVTTLTLLFATSFLLDIPLVQENIVRVLIIYLILLIELAIGISLYKIIAKK